MARGIACCGILSMLLWPMPGYTLSPREAVRQGNALYQAGAYDAAAWQYATAAQALPEAVEVHFNRGNAAYKRQDYAQALEHYTRALYIAAPPLESWTKYNLGNVQYQQALQALARPQEAMALARAAITYYRDSLEADPQQLDAQYNLELAYRLVQQLQHNLPSQPQQGSLQHQASLQRQPQAPQPAPSQTTQEAQTSQGQQPSHSHTTADQSEMRQAARPHQLSPEEGERLLEMIRERAREAERVRAQWQRTKSRDARVDKDW